jgi:hypothetical protein
VTLAAAALIACNLTGVLQPEPAAVSGPSPSAAQTQSEAGTLAALSTALAGTTPAATETLATEPTPSETPQVSVTYSLTRAPYGTPGTNPAAPLQEQCNAAFFVGYVGLGDGAPVGAATTFKKVWDVRNIGTCTWTRDYRLVFYNGEHMSGPNWVPFPQEVAPGDHMFIGVIMIAPYEGGTHTGYWMLQAEDGSQFGVGERGNKPLRGSIFVP